MNNEEFDQINKAIRKFGIYGYIAVIAIALLLNANLYILLTGILIIFTIRIFATTKILHTYNQGESINFSYSLLIEPVKIIALLLTLSYLMYNFFSTANSLVLLSWLVLIFVIGLFIGHDLENFIKSI